MNAKTPLLFPLVSLAILLLSSPALAQTLPEPTPRPGDVQGLRIAPVEWFYQDEPPSEAPEPASRLLPARGTRTAEIPSVFCDGRFLVKMSDVAAFTGDPIDADMFAPLNQVLTFLGYKPSYDESNLNDPVRPRLIATIGKKD